MISAADLLWGKLASGILSGNSYAFGDFDECLSIANNSNSDNESDTNFHGQYCLTD